MREHDSPVAGEAGEPPKPMRNDKSSSSNDCCRALKRAARAGGWEKRLRRRGRPQESPGVWSEPDRADIDLARSV